MESLRKVEKSTGLIREPVSVNLKAVHELVDDGRAQHINLLGAAEALCRSERHFREIIDALPAAIYTTDAEGRLTHFNRAAVELSGRVPELGTDHWCVTWKLYYPDGKPMRHDECPMAVSLRERRPVRDAEAIAERPDGTRFWFQPYPTPLFDESGDLIGGINMLVDITERKNAEAQIQSHADALTKLNELSSRLWTMRSLREGLDEMLAATIEMLGADFGNIQLLDVNRGALIIEAQRGFKQDFLDFFREVSASDDSACGRALRSGERIIVEDVEIDAPSAPMLHVIRAANYRAVQSTPLNGRGGKPLGIISTHFRSVHRPSEHELRRLDLYARQASDFIERCRADEALHRAQTQLEAELADTRLLASVSAELVHEENIEALYEKIIDAAVGIMHSDFANMQMLVPERRDGRGELLLLGHRGLAPEDADTWKWVSSDSHCIYGEALRTGGRVIVPDFESCAFMAGTPGLASYRSAGIRAAQSTLLRSRAGEVLGMISTHWREPHQPHERELRLLDVLARQAADLIERKQAEKALRESEERFRTLADNMGQLAWICNQLGNVTWYNQRWLDYTGLTFEDMKGWDWSKVLHPDHLERVVALVKHSAETCEMWEDTFPLRGSDGSYRWFLSRAVPVRDEHGNIVRWFGTNTDIEDLKQAREAAETANRVKDEFLATVSHELRTPLNAIMGWTHLLTRGKLDEETSARGLETIARNASAQNQLISDLLDVSRIISGQLRFESGVVDLIPVIEAASETVRPAADARGVVLHLKLEQGAGLVSGDSMRLQQIVWNLFNNAVKFTPRGGQVTVRLKREYSSVVIIVSDTGEGISAEFLPYIFDRFRQAESTTKRQHNGLGLGLAIVRHLVEAHGGTIRASSKGVGKGATFTVTFPLLAVHRDGIDAERAFLPAGSAISAPSAILKGLRVLVIDDEEDARELLTIALTQSGAEVRTAATVGAALEILDQWKPNVLVSDIGMPGEDGYDLIRTVRALESERGGTVPALALTGYASAEDAARARVAGYQTHMAKPVAPSDLIVAVASLVAEGFVNRKST
jgi:PAS domain S-box-containing protein